MQALKRSVLPSSMQTKIFCISFILSFFHSPQSQSFTHSLLEEDISDISSVCYLTVKTLYTRSNKGLKWVKS